MTFHQKEFLKLIDRSQDRGEGWRSVSTVLLPVAEKVAIALPNLIELDKDGSRVRLTEQGKGLVTHDELEFIVVDEILTELERLKANG